MGRGGGWGGGQFSNVFNEPEKEKKRGMLPSQANKKMKI
jgi:hypothetical protein